MQFPIEIKCEQATPKQNQIKHDEIQIMLQLIPEDLEYYIQQSAETRIHHDDDVHAVLQPNLPEEHFFHSLFTIQI